MPKFRKKPVVIEAFQMTKERRWDNSEWPEWLNRAWNNDSGEGPAIWIDPTDPDLERLICGTLEGPHEITWDDFLIEGVKGELYPCKPDIFEATYTAVPPPDEWERATTEGQRKAWYDQWKPPCGECPGLKEPEDVCKHGWQLDFSRGREGEAWDRFDYTEESYWKRLRTPEAKEVG